MSDNNIFREPTTILDFNHPIFTEYLSDIDLTKSIKEQILKLYLKVRDDFLYDPYHLDLRPEKLKASHVLKKNRAWCVEKSNVFAAASRKLGVASRVAYQIIC